MLRCWGVCPSQDRPVGGRGLLNNGPWVSMPHAGTCENSVLHGNTGDSIEGLEMEDGRGLPGWSSVTPGSLQEGGRSPEPGSAALPDTGKGRRRPSPEPPQGTSPVPHFLDFWPVEL